MEDINSFNNKNVYKKDLYYSLLDIDISKKEIGEIIHIAKNIIRNNKDRFECAKAYIKIAQCFQKVSNFSWSIFPLKIALKLLPINIDAILCKGRIFIYFKKYSKAIACFDKAINLLNDNVSNNINIEYIYWLKAITYDDNDKYNDAIHYYNKAIQLKEDFVFAYLNRGLAHLKKKYFEKAKYDYRKVICLKKNFAQAYDNLAFCYFREEKHKENINKKYTKKNNIYDKAISTCMEAIDFKPVYPPLYYTLGLINFELNMFEKSLDYFFTYLRLVKEDDEYKSTYYYIDKIIFKKGIDILWVYKEKEEIINLLHNHYNHYNHFVKIFLFLVNNKLLNNEFKNILTTVFDFWKDSYQTNMNDKKPDVIYQYTKIEVLKKMYDNKALRLTPAQYQNDPEEGQLIYKYINKNTDNKYLKGILRYLIKNNNLDEIEFDETVAFIRSFTKKENDLLMWRLYGDDGHGVSIGIPTGLFSKGDGFFRNEGFYAYDLFPGKFRAIKGMPIVNTGLFKVKYTSDVELKDFYKKILILLEKIFKKPHLLIEENIYREFIEILFLPINHIIKNDIHKHEDEYRLIYISTINEAKDYIIKNENPEYGIYIETEEMLFGMHKKDNENKTINYIDIYFGPKTNNLTYLKYKHSFENKYNKFDKNKKTTEKIVVALSKIPYR
jgi:tetratricopeptide (TPR) repeat protein